MFKSVLGSVLLMSSVISSAQTAVAIQDNRDIGLTLSQSNYNRLVVKGDKIVEAVFPEHAMGIKRDEQDGSVYVMLQSPSPFTLFLTTESGHHFSVTVTGEEGLGKTVELNAPKAPLSTHVVQAPVQANPNTDSAHQDAMVLLIQQMEKKEPLVGMSVSHPFGRVERMGAGLTLIPKEVWTGEGIIAERLDVINRGKETLNLLPSYFEGKDVSALKLSETSVKPSETITLYRVREVAHG